MWWKSRLQKASVLLSIRKISFWGQRIVKNIIFANMKEAIHNKEQILTTILNNQKDIRGFGVSKIGLFGSFVRNEQNEKSDIDLIVQFEQGKKSYLKFINLSDYLENLFDKKVDLLTEKAISPYMKSKVKKEAIYVSISN